MLPGQFRYTSTLKIHSSTRPLFYPLIHERKIKVLVKAEDEEHGRAKVPQLQKKMRWHQTKQPSRPRRRRNREVQERGTQGDRPWPRQNQTASQEFG